MIVRYREARKLKNLKVIEAAELLGVTQPTLSIWESGKKSPTIENLLRMADLYEVSIDYLLGRDFIQDGNKMISISQDSLPLFDGKPVWLPVKGWALVNFEKRILIFSDSHVEQIRDAHYTYMVPAPDDHTAKYKLYKRDELKAQMKIWLEPISSDGQLRNELRGWYQIIGNYAENQNGNRFSLDTYEAKWLAFANSPI